MLRSSLVAALGAFVLLACADSSQAPPALSPTPPTTVALPPPVVVAAPVADPPDAAPTPALVTTSADAGTVALATGDGGPVANEEGVDPQYRSCSVDADCVSVERVGCCHNGHMVGVAVSQKDAYLKSFTCPTKRPKCPMYRLKPDGRVGACDSASHMCGLK